MAGNKAGSKKTAKKLLAKDPDFYRKLGALGGAKKNPDKGFGSIPLEERREIARRGGLNRWKKSSHE